MTDFDVKAALLRETAQNDQLVAAAMEHPEEIEERVTVAAVAIASWAKMLLDIGTPPENVAASLAAMSYRCVRELEGRK